MPELVSIISEGEYVVFTFKAGLYFMGHISHNKVSMELEGLFQVAEFVFRDLSMTPEDVRKALEWMELDSEC